jgi:hypothetical protein
MASSTLSQRAARRCGELHHGDGDRRVAQAIEARRRVAPRRLGQAWINGREVGGPDARFVHLERSYDYRAIRVLRRG